MSTISTKHGAKIYYNMVNEDLLGFLKNVSIERPGGRLLRPAGEIIVTRVKPTAVRTACVTVLFADLRGYTGMAERLPAVRVMPLLDEFSRTLAAPPRRTAARYSTWRAMESWRDSASRRAAATELAKPWPQATRCCRTSRPLRHDGVASCRSRPESASDCITEKWPSEC